ncbi:hypothetical protein [Deinococcus peraridilitoris]|uniref:hypothetical protein n=1 Tax=Deinococcus peraridilitoris TaxID=432329 RepID=UPI0003000F9B|nr:hypothetical protein [Deinococcus peraridilitoris]
MPVNGPSPRILQDEVHRVDDLGIEKDIRTQQRAWTVQRVLWGLALLMALAALLGLLGGSRPLNTIISANDRGLQVKCPSFARRKAEMQVTHLWTPRGI